MSKLKILYVEDETAMARIVSDALQSRGYLVITETQGTNVLARFKETAPDICVLDVMLPGKDGFSIAGDIRALNTQVPIIFLTAKGAVNDVVTGFKRGGNDYIRKPFSIEELIVRIENVKRRQRPSRKRWFWVGMFFRKIARCCRMAANSASCRTARASC
jgi:DNA-binding response OmpR family regulator